MQNHTRFFGNLCNATDRLEEIKSYHQELETLIENEKLKFRNLNVDIDENLELYNKKFHVDYTLTPNLRASVIVSLVTFLEIELQNICCDLQKALSLQLTYNNFKGTVLDQFKIYTNKVVSLGIDFAGQDFQSVKEVIELRNCIVHYDGQIEDFYGRRFSRSDVITTLTKKFPSIKLEENDFIRLEYDACKECIAIVEKFISSIYNYVLIRFP